MDSQSARGILDRFTVLLRNTGGLFNTGRPAAADSGFSVPAPPIAGTGGSTVVRHTFSTASDAAAPLWRNSAHEAVGAAPAAAGYRQLPTELGRAVSRGSAEAADQHVRYEDMQGMQQTAHAASAAASYDAGVRAAQLDNGDMAAPEPLKSNAAARAYTLTMSPVSSTLQPMQDSQAPEQLTPQAATHQPLESLSLRLNGLSSGIPSPDVSADNPEQQRLLLQYEMSKWRSQSGEVEAAASPCSIAAEASPVQANAGGSRMAHSAAGRRQLQLGAAAQLQQTAPFGAWRVAAEGHSSQGQDIHMDEDAAGLQLQLAQEEVWQDTGAATPTHSGIHLSTPPEASSLAAGPSTKPDAEGPCDSEGRITRHMSFMTARSSGGSSGCSSVQGGPATHQEQAVQDIYEGTASGGPSQPAADHSPGAGICSGAPAVHGSCGSPEPFSEHPNIQHLQQPAHSLFQQYERPYGLNSPSIADRSVSPYAADRLAKAVPEPTARTCAAEANEQPSSEQGAARRAAGDPAATSTRQLLPHTLQDKDHDQDQVQEQPLAGPSAEAEPLLPQLVSPAAIGVEPVNVDSSGLQLGLLDTHQAIQLSPSTVEPAAAMPTAAVITPSLFMSGAAGMSLGALQGPSSAAYGGSFPLLLPPVGEAAFHGSAACDAQPESDVATPVGLAAHLMTTPRTGASPLVTTPCTDIAAEQAAHELFSGFHAGPTDSHAAPAANRSAAADLLAGSPAAASMEHCSTADPAAMCPTDSGSGLLKRASCSAAVGDLEDPPAKRQCNQVPAASELLALPLSPYEEEEEQEEEQPPQQQQQQQQQHEQLDWSGSLDASAVLASVPEMPTAQMAPAASALPGAAVWRSASGQQEASTAHGYSAASGPAEHTVCDITLIQDVPASSAAADVAPASQGHAAASEHGATGQAMDSSAGGVQEMSSSDTQEHSTQPSSAPGIEFWRQVAATWLSAEAVKEREGVLQWLRDGARPGDNDAAAGCQQLLPELHALLAAPAGALSAGPIQHRH